MRPPLNQEGMGSNLSLAQTLLLGYEAFLASKWPKIILEVTPDLKFELCGLNNPCAILFWPLNDSISRSSYENL